MRFIAAAPFVLLLLGVTMRAASADYPTSGSQNQFVATCKKLGGTPKSEGTHIVSCTGSGGKETCNFNTNTCVTTFTQPTDPSDPQAPVGGGVLDTGGTATNDPHSPVGGGVLVQVEIAPSTPNTGGGVFVATTTEIVLREPEAAPASQDERSTVTDGAWFVADDVKQP